MYRGQSGMWLWVLHRLTGVGILAFLFLHIADTYLVGLGPSYYNELVFLYHLPPFRILEVLLVGAVLFHAVNGVRVILFDFWDRANALHKRLDYGMVIVFFVLFIPVAFIMIKNIDWANWTIQTVAAK